MSLPLYPCPPAELSEGCYLLRSNINNWSAEDLWRADIQLTEAEAAFRIHKSDLRIRPIWHQWDDRVLPTRAGPALRRRCITRPTDHQAILLQHLGLNLPSHLKTNPMS